FIAEGRGFLRRLGALLRPLGRSLLVIAAVTATAAATAIAAADELEVLDDDAELGTLAAALLVFPLVVLEAAFDEDGFTLLAVLVDDFSRFAEGGTVDKGGFLALLATGGEPAIHRQAE